MDDFAEEEVVENPTLRAAYNLAPLHQNQPLCWDYEVKLIGDKIYDKIIHLCETCELPILVYGRLLPCKHIFCFDCARKCDKLCERCCAKVQKVEKSALGTVYVCTHGAPKHSTKGCRRTYLSQRDLQAHIAHRHLPKASSSSSSSTSSSAPIQPAPNQLPLTKQQAAQQASQKQVGAQDMSHASPVQPHLISSVLPGQSSLAPPMNNQQQQSGLPISAQQLSPAPPHIPGLGDLRSPATAAQSSLGQNSPLMQPSQNPNILPQGMGPSYGAPSQTNPDMFRPMEMSQQQIQQAIGIPSSHLQPNQTHQTYPQSAQFPVSTPMMQQISSQQLPSTVSTPMHPNAFTHSHPSMSGPQSLDNYNEQQNMPPTQISQSRTNVNLITVPIQDEGQYRPIPYINSSLAPHPGSSYPQTRPNMPSQTQAYTQPPMSSSTFSTPSTFPQMSSGTFPTPSTFPQMSSGTFPTPSTFPQMSSGTFSTPNTFPQMAGPPHNMTTPNSPQGLPFNQSNTLHANSPGVMVNPRQAMGGNVHPSVPRALADVMHHAMTMAAVRAQGQGGGLMPTPVPGGQGVVNRFPPGGHWATQRMMPPRIQQPQQQRPQAEGQFNQSGYYH